MATDQQNMPFIKNLASSDRKMREASLDTLRTFLSASARSRALSPLENLKLWKGLFYSLWMCDRPVPQQNLCAELAGLVSVVAAGAAGAGGATGGADSVRAEAETVTAFLEAFWTTLAREWTSIDVLRMEKFLLLVRRVFGAGLVWATKGQGSLSTAGDDSEGAAVAKNGSSSSSSSSSRKERRKAVNDNATTTATGKKRAAAASATTKQEEYQKKNNKIREDALLTLLAELPLDPTGDLAKMPVGLRLHVLDLWVDEAEKAGLLLQQSEEEETTQNEPETQQRKRRKHSQSEEEEEDDDADDAEDQQQEGEGQDGGFLFRLSELVETQFASPSKPVRARARDSLADERLPWNEGAGLSDEDDDDEDGGSDDEEMSGGGDDWGGFDD